MNLRRWFLLKSSATILLLCASVIRANAQASPAKHHGEQTSFSMEFEFEQPVRLDEAAKEALTTSPRLAHDLKQNHLGPKDVPDLWFMASRVHLGGNGEVGLVVMGWDGLLGANTTSFWILRQTAKGYDLVLDTYAAGLDVLNTRTDDLRDIEISFPGGAAYWGSERFQFDGQSYHVTERTSQTAEIRIPTDLAKYDTHSPFVQQKDDDTSPALAEARTWIWRHWKTHKRFYVTVVAQDDDGNQATYQLYTSDDSNYPGLILKIHKIKWEQESPSRSRRKIVEDDLWAVPDVERVYPAVDEDHDPQVIPDGADVAASVYRLGFLEGIHWLATL